jgi:hypothetical protein
LFSTTIAFGRKLCHFRHILPPYRRADYLRTLEAACCFSEENFLFDKYNRQTYITLDLLLSLIYCLGRKGIFLAVLLSVIVVFSPAVIGAESLPGPAIPDGFGINIHFTGLPRDLKMIADAGFKFIRMDLVWSRIEKTKGVYNFKGSGYDSLTLGCEELGIRVLYILDYSNELYESDRSVRTEAGRKAFADFAEAAAKRYAGKGILWEIWNEANIKQFWSPQPSMDDYCKLVEAAASRIRNADPSGQVVAGATSQIPLEWFEDCFKNGLLNWIDVLSVHPYRSQPPETVIQGTNPP